MAITTYRNRNWLTPWAELDQMNDRLTRFFGDGSPGDGRETSWMPPVNVEETRDFLMLTAELPGMRREDVEIDLENNVLTLRGSKGERREEGEDRRYHLWERRSGSFQRSFSLPRTVRAEEISATFEDGVLRVHMPKAPEAKGRKIEIRSGSEG